ncbi:MAG TPA: hypothetical protein ENJ51_12290 [Leucothrix mucor]|uniref:Uncharacterized protein n=1 Tax=Leucothrix mucor TaxID=45248 RepID=A0A7V2T4Z1_LEUMU|nr:hypothetical protein [Leucothrix mucor]
MFLTTIVLILSYITFNTAQANQYITSNWYPTIWKVKNDPNLRDAYYATTFTLMQDLYSYDTYGAFNPDTAVDDVWVYGNVGVNAIADELYYWGYNAVVVQLGNSDYLHLGDIIEVVKNGVPVDLVVVSDFAGWDSQLQNYAGVFYDPTTATEASAMITSWVGAYAVVRNY